MHEFSKWECRQYGSSRIRQCGNNKGNICGSCNHSNEIVSYVKWTNPVLLLKIAKMQRKTCGNSDSSQCCCSSFRGRPRSGSD